MKQHFLSIDSDCVKWLVSSGGDCRDPPAEVLNMARMNESTRRRLYRQRWPKRSTLLFLLCLRCQRLYKLRRTFLQRKCPALSRPMEAVFPATMTPMSLRRVICRPTSTVQLVRCLARFGPTWQWVISSRWTVKGGCSKVHSYDRQTKSCSLLWRQLLHLMRMQRLAKSDQRWSMYPITAVLIHHF